MRLSNTQLIGLPAVTKTGELLGQVVGFEFDADQHVITMYFIGPGKLIERIFGTVRNTQPLLISTSQVISLDNEKMTVHDSALVVPIGPKSRGLKNDSTLAQAAASLEVN